jgi:predicted nucleic acid-binding protein
MIYADTTFILAWRVPWGPRHAPALDFYESRQDEVWVWSPWHRVEVFNTARQLTRDEDPRARLLPAEARTFIRQLEADLRVDYLTHFEADWRDVLRAANDLSIAHAFNLRIRAADLLHVAYALETNSEVFVTYDNDQFALAEAAGLEAVMPV